MSQYTEELIATAKAISFPGKGILAADESTGTIGKRFKPIQVGNTEANRRAYRELLFTTPNLGDYVSAAICFEETLFQNTQAGESFVSCLKARNIIPGIKVDKGVQPLYHTSGETVTQGMDGLAERCQRYYQQGARFAKWRAVLHINEQAPSALGIDQNAETLARYAAICQSAGLVPIVEPEILMDGAHSIETSAAVTERVLAACFKKLSDHHVLLEGMLLKPNMVRPGADNTDKDNTMAAIGKATVRVLQHTVPPAVPGITFLSGGMSEEDATVALNEINKEGDAKKKPWALTFSYGRALQKTVLTTWSGKPENVTAAQAALMVRAKANSMATLGNYDGFANAANGATASLHQKNYTY